MAGSTASMHINYEGAAHGAVDAHMVPANSTPTTAATGGAQPATAASSSAEGVPHAAQGASSANHSSHAAASMDVSGAAATAANPAASGAASSDGSSRASGSSAAAASSSSSSSSSAGAAAAAASSSSSAAAPSSAPSAVHPHLIIGGRRPTNDRMIIKLTTNLMNTYNAINEKYYANKRLRLLEQEQAQRALKAKAGGSSSGAPIYNDGHDDKDYNYIVTPQELLANRYVVDHSIGKGSFGRVVKAYDTLARKYVAVKIVKSKSAFYKQAQIELKILLSLQHDADKWNIVNVIDQFIHKNHQCIVFELLSLNLYELLRNTRFTGVSLKLIAKFGQQLLLTLGHLGSKERGEKRIIHCDLKPENILLRSCKKSAIKVIDFGSACFANQKTYTYIQSRFYRAPEVLLALSYNGSIDMWSLGCILVEMHTGKPLFDGQDEADQMVKQVEILGMPPRHMLEKNRKAEKFFEISESTGQFRLKRKYGAQLGGSLRRALAPKWDGTSELYLHFEDLLSKMLLYDPLLRIRPSQALQHPFFAAVADSISKAAGPYASATPDTAAAVSASGANLSSACGNPEGSGSGVAAGLGANAAGAGGAAAAAAAVHMDTSSPRTSAAATGGGEGSDAASLAHAQAQAQAQKLALMQQQQQLHHMQQHRYQQQHNPRKRPHSNPLFGGQAGPMPSIHFGVHTHGLHIQPLDPHVQQAIAAQSNKQTRKQTAQQQQAAAAAAAAAAAPQTEQPPVQRHNNLMQDSGAAASADVAGAAGEAAAPKAASSGESGASSSSTGNGSGSGAPMEDALQPDQTSTVVSASNQQTPTRAHGMVTRSSARSGNAEATPSSGVPSAAALAVKRDSLDIAGLRVNPLSAASSANNSSRSSPQPATDDSKAAAAVSSTTLGVTPAADARSRGNSQLTVPPSGALFGDASTATTANASATSSPKQPLVGQPPFAHSLSLPDTAANAAAAAAANSMVDVDEHAKQLANAAVADSGSAIAAPAASSSHQSPSSKKGSGGGSGGGGSSGKRGKRGKKHGHSSSSAAAAAANAGTESESEGGASSSQLSRMSLDLDHEADVVGRRTRSHANQ